MGPSLDVVKDCIAALCMPSKNFRTDWQIRT